MYIYALTAAMDDAGDGVAEMTAFGATVWWYNGGVGGRQWCRCLAV